MTIYEHNFSRLVALLPGLRQLSGQLTALGRQQRRLTVEVVEHYKYTTVLRITQNLPISIPAVGLSHMTVRIYHRSLGVCSGSYGAFLLGLSRRAMRWWAMERNRVF